MAKMQDTDRHGNKRSSITKAGAVVSKTAAVANVGTEQTKYCECHVFMYVLVIFSIMIVRSSLTVLVLS